jgi:hypothetical protein
MTLKDIVFIPLHRKRLLCKTDVKCGLLSSNNRPAVSGMASTLCLLSEGDYLNEYNYISHTFQHWGFLF